MTAEAAPKYGSLATAARRRPRAFYIGAVAMVALWGWMVLAVNQYAGLQVDAWYFLAAYFTAHIVAAVWLARYGQRSRWHQVLWALVGVLFSVAAVIPVNDL